MTTRRRIEIACDLCSYQEDFALLAAAWMCGWKRDRWPNGEIVDLCADCAAKVLNPKVTADA